MFNLFGKKKRNALVDELTGAYNELKINTSMMCKDLKMFNYDGDIKHINDYNWRLERNTQLNNQITSLIEAIGEEM